MFRININFFKSYSIRNYKNFNFYFIFKRNLMEQPKAEIKGKTSKVSY